MSHFVPIKMAVIQKMETSQSWQGCGESEPLRTVGKNASGAAAMENSMMGPQKVNAELPYHPAVPLLGMCPNCIWA